MSVNSNQLGPDYSILSEKLNSLIKLSLPTITIGDYIKPSLEALNSSINLSIQPLINYMNETNKEMVDTINKTMSNLALDALNNLKTISLYSTDTLESIDKSLFIETIDEIYNSVEINDFPNNFSKDITACKEDIKIISDELVESSSNKLDLITFIEFVAAIVTIIQFFVAIYDDTSQIQIEQNKQIIENQSLQLKLLESIDNSLQKLVQQVD
ncbi:hypothetical protein JCM1393_25150 [Clostridium carnis]